MNKQEISAFLQANGIPFAVTERKAVCNMEELGDIALPYPEWDAVRDDKKREYYLITVKCSAGRTDCAPLLCDGRGACGKVHVAVLSEQRHAAAQAVAAENAAALKHAHAAPHIAHGKVAAVPKPCRNAAPQDAVKISSAYSFFAISVLSFQLILSF